MSSIKQVMISLGRPLILIILIPLVLILGIINTITFPLYNPYIVEISIGILLMGLGTILFSYCVHLFYKIGKGTLSSQSNLHTQHLVIVGPYKYVRNPMDLGLMVILFGESLFLRSFILLIYSIICLIISIVYVYLSEEKDLKARFGQEFLDYKKSVRAWIPRLKPYNPQAKKSMEEES